MDRIAGDVGFTRRVYLTIILFNFIENGDDIDKLSSFTKHVLALDVLKKTMSEELYKIVLILRKLK